LVQGRTVNRSSGTNLRPLTEIEATVLTVSVLPPASAADGLASPQAGNTGPCKHDGAHGFADDSALLSTLFVNSTIYNPLVGCVAVNIVGIVPGSDVLRIVFVEGSREERI
jgi:hypothetical protein